MIRKVGCSIPGWDCTDFYSVSGAQLGVGEDAAQFTL